MTKIIQKGDPDFKLGARMEAPKLKFDADFGLGASVKVPKVEVKSYSTDVDFKLG